MLAFVVGGLSILVGLLALFAGSALTGYVVGFLLGGIVIVISILVLAVGALYIWSGLMALQGKNAKILTIVAIVAAVLELIGLISSWSGAGRSSASARRSLPRSSRCCSSRRARPGSRARAAELLTATRQRRDGTMSYPGNPNDPYAQQGGQQRISKTRSPASSRAAIRRAASSNQAHPISGGFQQPDTRSSPTSSSRRPGSRDSDVEHSTRHHRNPARP
ncbi:hypothetical protein [Nakamurella sp.]|uniref:hypothetical protein n=1 Tax=Nakamurella sp. TaxID=1869182 RepID=UPI00378483A1